MTMQVHGAVPAQLVSPVAGYGDMGDIAFALAAFQLEALDSDMTARLEGMQKLTEIKKAYRERLAELQDLLGELPEADDRVMVEGDLGFKADFGVDPATGDVVMTGDEPLGDEWFGILVSRGGKVDPDDPLTYTSVGVTTYEEAQAILQERPDSIMKVQVDRTDVENEIARIQGKMDDLSGEGEMGLLALNRLLGKRNQVLQLASNVLGSQHQTAMGIISNIK